MNDCCARLADAEGKLAAAAKLHFAYRPVYTDDYDLCPECTEAQSGFDVRWPCRTALALGLA